MSIKDKLAIYLITYNRKWYLQKTFEQIFSQNSPIKDFEITILNNASTDGSSELIDEYCNKFPNITHIRHNLNIGGNANIVRAFEMSASSGKDYVWVLCDDDQYDFSNWNNIEQAVLSNKYDQIFVTHNFIKDTKNIAQLIFQATFIPSCIYATRLIDEDVIQNMYNGINYMFTQTFVYINTLCNHFEKVYISDESLIFPRGQNNDKTFVRGRNPKKTHPDSSRMFLQVAFMNTIQAIKDKKTKDYIVKNVRLATFVNQSFFQYLCYIVDYNAIYKNYNLKNLLELFCNLNLKQRLIFIYVILNDLIVHLIIPRNKEINHFKYYFEANTPWFKRPFASLDLILKCL